MINLIISDIKKALSVDAYFASLALALSLPDICGRAKYPKGNSKFRYIEWYDEYIGKYEHSPPIINDALSESLRFKYNIDVETPYLSGEVVYQLRCSLFHQGTPNIDKTKIEQSCNQIDYFTIYIEHENQFDIYSDGSSIVTNCSNGTTTKCYRFNVRRFCMTVCNATKHYYEINQEKFDFFDYELMTHEEFVRLTGCINKE